MSANIFAYANDIVLLAPSWHALQVLISTVEKYCVTLDLTCNTKKTVSMVFFLIEKSKVISHIFPNFIFYGQQLQFVTEFRYLGHYKPYKKQHER